MPFLGVEPTDTFSSVEKQTITGDGSTSYTLTHAVGADSDVAVFVNNVRQEPSTAYTASGTTITFTESLTSSDDCYLVYIARTFQSTDTAYPTGGGGNKVFYENDQSITADYTIAATKNAMTAGPVSVGTGVTVTVESGARWIIL